MNMRHLLAASAAITVSALAIGQATAAITITENFNTDPSLRGWSSSPALAASSGNFQQVTSTTTPNDYGWKAGEVLAGGSAGEAGGNFVKSNGTTSGTTTSTFSYWGVDLGILGWNTSENLNVTGKIYIDTSAGVDPSTQLGFFNSTNARQATPTSRLGIAFGDQSGDTLRLQIANNGLGAETNATGVNTVINDSPSSGGPTTFSIDWNATTKKLTLTYGSVTASANYAAVPANMVFDRFGFTNRTQNNSTSTQALNLRIDDVTLTTTGVPEPMSLSLIGLGSMALLGRRRRV